MPALIDRDARRFTELGLTSARLPDERWLGNAGSLEPLLLRVPLVRHQREFTVGLAPDTWTAWIERSRA